MPLLGKALAIWAAFIPLAIGNGLLREKALAPLIGERLALPLSGLTAAGLFFLLTYLTLPWLGILPSRHYLRIGAAWLLLTVLFEFVFGRYVAGKGWEELLQAYDLATGNLWLLVLAVVALAPYLAAKARGVV